MKKLNIENLELSEIGLGGSKFVDLSLEKGIELVNDIKQLGVTVLDGHHRYGVAEEVFSHFPDMVRMTKVSAYKLDSYKELVENSLKIFSGNVDVMWVSDLDDIVLYEKGKVIYDDLIKRFPLAGITTESWEMLFKFWHEYPKCKFFMVPVFIGMSPHMIKMIRVLKEDGRYIFGIKSFLAGLLLKDYSVRQCLEFVKKVSPYVLLVGTSNVEHLKEVIDIYESL